MKGRGTRQGRKGRRKREARRRGGRDGRKGRWWFGREGGRRKAMKREKRWKKSGSLLRGRHRVEIHTPVCVETCICTCVYIYICYIYI